MDHNRQPPEQYTHNTTATTVYLLLPTVANTWPIRFVFVRIVVVDEHRTVAAQVNVRTAKYFR